LIVGYFPVTPPVFQYIAPVLSVGNYLTYQWYFNSQPIIGANTNSITINQNGVYYVHVKDFNECEYDSSPFILDNLNIASIYQSNIIAYPNPTYNKVRIANLVFNSIRIKNQLGQVVSEEYTNEDIDFSFLPSGIYSVALYGNKNDLLGVIKITKY
jgi:hypothetical protein